MVNKFDEKTNLRIVQYDCSLISALKLMDDIHSKLLLVFKKEHFLSLISIGDIQRAIIKNKDLNDSLFSILNKDKIYCSISDSLDFIKAEMLSFRAECMPIIDNDGNLVKVIYWDDLFKEKTSSYKEKINIPVVIMAGGKGTRLKPITNIIPKPLIPFGDKTMIELIMDQFEDIGCKSFYLSVNYKAEIMKYYLDNLPHKYKIKYFKEDKPLGTIGSVRLMKQYLNNSFFVSNCDIIIDQDYRDVYKYHKENKNDITLITSLKNFQISYGVLETGENGILKELKEKPNFNYMINTGVYILNSNLIDYIPDNKLFHITDLIKKVQELGGKVGCFPVSEKSWKDIGEWDEYLKYNKL